MEIALLTREGGIDVATEADVVDVRKVVSYVRWMGNMSLRRSVKKSQTKSYYSSHRTKHDSQSTCSG